MSEVNRNKENETKKKIIVMANEKRGEKKK